MGKREEKKEEERVAPVAQISCIKAKPGFNSSLGPWLHVIPSHSLQSFLSISPAIHHYHNKAHMPKKIFTKNREKKRDSCTKTGMTCREEMTEAGGEVVGIKLLYSVYLTTTLR